MLSNNNLGTGKHNLFKYKWEDTFNEDSNVRQIFHSPNRDKETEFMTRNSSESYYFSDKFPAINQDFESNNKMWLILPDKSYSTNDVLDDENLLNLLFSKNSWENSKYLIIKRKIPKFDVVFDKNLVNNLKKTSDFSGMGVYKVHFLSPDMHILGFIILLYPVSYAVAIPSL